MISLRFEILMLRSTIIVTIGAQEFTARTAKRHKHSITGRRIRSKTSWGGDFLNEMKSRESLFVRVFSFYSAWCLYLSPPPEWVSEGGYTVVPVPLCSVDMRQATIPAL